MESEGLWADVRRVVLRGDVFGLAIAVAVGTALYHLFYDAFEYVPDSSRERIASIGAGS